jgi:hypothetical protein
MIQFAPLKWSAKRVHYVREREMKNKILGARLILLAALAWPRFAGAQANSDGDSSGSMGAGENDQRGGDQNERDQNGADQNGGGSEPERSMSLEDARDNFRTIVETYITRNSRNGVWAFEDAHGKRRRLTLVRVETGTVASLADSRYAGIALLRELGSNKTRRLRFVADFSGEHWKVVSVKDAPPPKR